MKRYLSLILVLILLLPCLVVPASASDANIVDAIQGQTQTLNDYLYSQFQDLTLFLDGVLNRISSHLLNIRNYILSFYGYFTDDTYGVYSEGNTLYNVTHFEMDLIDVWGLNWLWLYDYFFTADKTVNRAIISGSGTALYPSGVTVSGLTQFQVDLISLNNAIVNGLFNGFHRINNVLTAISATLQEIVSGDTDASSEVVGDVAQDSTEASEMLDIMDSVTKPDVGELEDLSDISGYVNAGDVSVLAACLSPFFQSAVFLPCIMLSLIFMLVAYVLYGKR